MDNVDAGQLTRRIELHCSTPVVATDGQPVEQTTGAGTLVAVRWARMRSVSGVVKNGEQQTVTDVTWQVVVRSDSVTRAIDYTYWLLTPDNTRLDVQWARDPDDSRQWIEMECVENRAK